jgi:hypothetical protein
MRNKICGSPEDLTTWIMSKTFENPIDPAILPGPEVPGDADGVMLAALRTRLGVELEVQPDDWRLYLNRPYSLDAEAVYSMSSL